jgi:hydroxymethylglutaryl-CoA lyase
LPKQKNIKYASEGEIKPQQVAAVATKLWEMGCYEISLGDTIGVGTPGKAYALLKHVSEKIPTPHLAVHFHDTYGQALANIYAVLPLGIAVIDSSVGGLGGCPYAPNSSGNVASEDVVYMLQGLGIETGINLNALVSVGQFISDYLGRPPRSKVTLALAGAKLKTKPNLFSGGIS